MRNEQEREVEPLTQVEDEVEDLRLDRDVEGGHGLVGEDELRRHREGTGDADALALAATELVRVAPGVLAPQPDLLEVVPGALVAHLPIAPAVLGIGLGQHPLPDDVADRHPRVQAGHRVLEDDLHAAAHLLEVVALALEDVLALEPRLALGRLLQAEQRPSEGRLPAAGLADEPEDLAAADLEADPVDRLDVRKHAPQDARPDRVVRLELLDLDEGRTDRERAGLGGRGRIDGVGHAVGDRHRSRWQHLWIGVVARESRPIGRIVQPAPRRTARSRGGSGSAPRERTGPRRRGSAARTCSRAASGTGSGRCP